MTLVQTFFAVRFLTIRQIAYRLLRMVGARTRFSPLSLDWYPCSVKASIGLDGLDHPRYSDGQFRFINRSSSFTGGDWNSPVFNKLWLYNLHYFDWIHELRDAQTAWIEQWIRENPPFSGNGWEPYPVSLRLNNWIMYFQNTERSPSDEILSSMGLQAAFLYNNLEFQHGANHLLENLIALKMVSFHLKPSGIARRIDAWLMSELQGQFLADGGHYERSPMYHSILLQRMIGLLNVWPRKDQGDMYMLLKSIVMKAMRWLSIMSVQGQIALFNDSCYDATPKISSLLTFGQAVLGCSDTFLVSDGLHMLGSSGYYRYQNQNYLMIWDGGPLGPDDNLAHAHCDIFSYCLWVNGEPVVVDSGNYEYIPGQMRAYCRSTAAHNALTVDNGEQAEMWRSHRVGRRGRPISVSAMPVAHGAVLEGRHDGFSHFSGAPLHERRIELREKQITVVDRVISSRRHQSDSFIHCAPDSNIVLDGLTAIIERAGVAVKILCSHQPILEEGWFCPEFGIKIQNKIIKITTSDNEMSYIIHIL